MPESRDKGNPSIAAIKLPFCVCLESRSKEAVVSRREAWEVQESWGKLPSGSARGSAVLLPPLTPIPQHAVVFGDRTFKAMMRYVKVRRVDPYPTG